MQLAKIDHGPVNSNALQNVTFLAGGKSSWDWVVLKNPLQTLVEEIHLSK